MTRTIFNKSCELIQAPFTLSATNPVSASIVYGVYGSSQIVVTGSNLFYCVSGTIGTTNYSSFCASLQYALNTAGVSTGSGANWTVGYNQARGTISIINDLDEITFIVKAGISEQILGLDSGIADVSPSNFEITGNYVPHYVWRSQYDARSNWTKQHEPTAFWTDHVADDGSTFSIGREGTEQLSMWRWEMEQEEHVRKLSANPSEPWTWQHFVEYVRANIPWTVHTSSITAPDWTNKEGIYRLTAEASNFKPINFDANWQLYYHLPVTARIVGSGSGNGLF